MNNHDKLTITFLKNTSIVGEENRLNQTHLPTIEGAKAALETFYYAFNNCSLELFREVWLNDPFIQLNNLLGGIIRGIKPISDLYIRIFTGPVRVRVGFYDIVVFQTSQIVVFAGRERGTYTKGKRASSLDIRTTRIFAYAPEQGGWRQIHHHGSIDEISDLTNYKKVVLGSDGKKRKK